MERKEIIDYFKKNLKKGYAMDSLRLALINQGYSRVLVNLSAERAIKELAKEVPAFREKPKIKYEIIDENDNPVTIKKPWWKRMFGF